MVDNKECIGDSLKWCWWCHTLLNDDNVLIDDDGSIHRTYGNILCVDCLNHNKNGDKCD